MTYYNDLLRLKELMQDENKLQEFQNHVKFMNETYTSESERKEIEKTLEECTETLLAKADKQIEDISIKMQLQEVSEIISLSYLAKKYFGKTKAWLYQRVNGNIVNGKPCKFTPEELNTLNEALQDISKKIGSLNISY